MRASFHFPYVEHDVFFSKRKPARVLIELRAERRRANHPEISVPTAEEVVSEIRVMLAAHLAIVAIVILALTATGIQ